MRGNPGGLLARPSRDRTDRHACLRPRPKRRPLSRIGHAGDADRRLRQRGVRCRRERFSVQVDNAKVIRLPEKTQTVVVGNPMIADITLQKNGVVVLTGKSFGSTNLIALDGKGAMLAESTISVQAPQASIITVQRGLDRESYSCTPNLPTLGPARRRHQVLHRDQSAGRAAPHHGHRQPIGPRRRARRRCHGRRLAVWPARALETPLEHGRAGYGRAVRPRLRPLVVGPAPSIRKGSRHERHQDA